VERGTTTHHSIDDCRVLEGKVEGAPHKSVLLANCASAAPGAFHATVTVRHETTDAILRRVHIAPLESGGHVMYDESDAERPVVDGGQSQSPTKVGGLAAALDAWRAGSVPATPPAAHVAKTTGDALLLLQRGGGKTHLKGRALNHVALSSTARVAAAEGASETASGTASDTDTAGLLQTGRAAQTGEKYLKLVLVNDAQRVKDMGGSADKVKDSCVALTTQLTTMFDDLTKNMGEQIVVVVPGTPL
jgi:hypothetical protein